MTPAAAPVEGAQVAAIISKRIKRKVEFSGAKDPVAAAVVMGTTREMSTLSSLVTF